MRATRYFETEKAFSDAIFYYTFNQFIVKPDMENENYSYAIVNSDEGERLIFHVTNKFLTQQELECDLNVVRLGFNE